MSEDEKRDYPDQYMMRFPKGMRDELKSAAKENGRALNAEIIARLDIANNFEQEKNKLIKERDYFKQRCIELDAHLNAAKKESERFEVVLINKEKELAAQRDDTNKLRKQTEKHLRILIIHLTTIADYFDLLIKQYSQKADFDPRSADILQKLMRSAIDMWTKALDDDGDLDASIDSKEE